MGDVDIDRVLYASVIIYLILMITLILIQPSIMFDHKMKKLKSFGFDDKETLFALPVIGIVASVLIYFTSIAYSNVLSSLK